MPSPAFEKLKKTVSTTLTTAIAAGDKAYRTAAPVVRRTAEDVVAKVTHRDDQAPAGPAAAEPAAAPEAKVSPASIAKNVAPERPHATPVAPEAAPDPEDSPGGKLPPRR